MGSTAHRFRAGHRIRLLVAGGAYPRWLRNHGTGEPAATATRMVPTETTVQHGSVLVLTVV
jgi:predicted acyl esterase